MAQAPLSNGVLLRCREVGASEMLVIWEGSVGLDTGRTGPNLHPHLWRGETWLMSAKFFHSTLGPAWRPKHRPAMGKAVLQPGSPAGGSVKQWSL